MHRGPAYRIETQRLLVRCWDPADARCLHEVLAGSRAHLAAWVEWARDEPRRLEDRVQVLRSLRARFDRDEVRAHAVLDADERVLHGGVDLHGVELDGAGDEDALQLGFWLAPASLGRGVATEAAAALVRTAFEIDRVARVEIRCDADNLRARALAERLGFRLDAELRSRSQRTASARAARCIYSLLAEEYADSPAARVAVRAFDAAGTRILG